MNTNLNPVMVQALKGFMPPARKKFNADIDSTISGIPCGIWIGTIDIKEGNYSPRAETPDEYHGHRDIEFKVLDRSGYPAPWLEAKMTNEDTSRIEGEILESLKEAA